MFLDSYQFLPLTEQQHMLAKFNLHKAMPIVIRPIKMQENVIIKDEQNRKHSSPSR